MKYDESYWRDMKAVSLASMQGFSPMIQLPELIYKTYPDMKRWVFGIFDDDSYPARFVDGWRPMYADDFPDYESFTDAIGSRFGLKPHVDGRLMIGTQFVMKMPRKYRTEEYEPAIRNLTEKRFKELVHASPNIAPGVQSEVEYEEKRVVHSASAPKTEPPKRGRGRPRKEK